MIQNLLTIAGSDPSGGAGIQADLKTFSALGCYGMAAITALTVQNTKGVSGVQDVPADFVRQQIEAIFDDIRVDAVKIGMAGSAETICVISNIIKKYNNLYIILDPVMVAASGDILLSKEAQEALKRDLVPLATVITPNLEEARALLGYEDTQENMARALLKTGAQAILVKGGHATGPDAVDILVTADGMESYKSERVKTKNTHGTGCALSSALACYMARGLPLSEAMRAAKSYITGAIHCADSLKIGQGAGPVHHFYTLWD